MPPNARNHSRGGCKGSGSTCKWFDPYKWLATWPAAGDCQRTICQPTNDIDRGRRNNTSNTTKLTERRQTPYNFSQLRSLPRGESDFSADAWGETPRHGTFWHNIGAWPRKRILFTVLIRRSRVQRRALSRSQDNFSTRPRTSSPRRG